MTKNEADRLIAVIQDCVTTPRAMSVASDHGEAIAPLVGRNGKAEGLKLDAEEALYQRFKRRLIDECKTDPVLLRLLTLRPEIILELEPREVRVDGATLRGRIAKLLAAGWFQSGRATGAVRKELTRTGADPGGGGNLSDTLSALCREGFFIRDGDGWSAAPDLKITQTEITSRG